MYKKQQFLPLYSFCFYKCLVTRAFKKVQYGNQGKNGVFSDYTKCTYCEIYSSSNTRVKWGPVAFLLLAFYKVPLQSLLTSNGH